MTKILESTKDNQKPQGNNANRVLSGVFTVYWMLFCCFFPLAIGIIPVAISLMTENDSWGWWMLLSMPICTSLAMQMWHPEFMSKIDKWLPNAR